MSLYEAHITVDESDKDQWLDHCQFWHMKPLIIELNNGTGPVGQHPRQLMCAYHQETDLNRFLSQVEDRTFSWWDRTIQRIKIEMMLDHARDDEPFAYDECHMKIFCSGEAIESICEHVGVYASRNLFNVGSPDAEKWYLTARTYGRSPVESAARFAEVFAEVSRMCPSVRLEMERVLSDTNPNLDADWVV